MRNLQVGDKIYRTTSGRISCVGEVYRTTKTMAIVMGSGMVGEVRFKISVDNIGGINPIPMRSYNGKYVVGDWKMELEFKKQKMILFFGRCNYENISFEKINKIYEIIISEDGV